MTTFPRHAGFDLYSRNPKPPEKQRRAHPMIWFSASLASSAFVVLGVVSQWAIDSGYVIGALATAIVAAIGGHKALRKSAKRDTKEAVKETVQPAVDQALKASAFPTDPQQRQEFAREVAKELWKIHREEQTPKVQT